MAQEHSRQDSQARETSGLAAAARAVGEIVHSPLDPHEIVRRILEEGARAFGAETGAVSVHEEKGFRVTYAYGFPSDIVGTRLSDEQERHSLLAMETRRPLAIEDTSADTRCDGDHLQSYGVAAVIVIPLVIRGEAIGDAFYNFGRPRTFSAREMEFAEQLGDAISTALSEGRSILFGDIGERQAAEQALRESERKYRGLFTHLIDGFALHEIVLDDTGSPVDYVFLEVNQAFRELSGVGDRDVVGHRVTEVFPGIENDSADWIGMYGRVALSGEPARFEQHSDALNRWYLVSAYSPERGKFVTVFDDITDRKHAEEELARTNERLTLLAESARLLLTSDKPESVIQTIAEKVMAFLGCHVFFNYVIQPGGNAMRLNAYGGVRPADARAIESLELGRAVCGCVARDGCRIVAEDIQHTDDPRTEVVKAFGVTAYACHPLIFRGDTIGTLSFGCKDRTAFEPDELDVMKIVADLAATAMARSMAEDRRREAEIEREQERDRLRAIIDEVPIGLMLFTPSGEMTEFSATSRMLWGVGPPRGAISQMRLTDIPARKHGTDQLLAEEDWPLHATVATGEPAEALVDLCTSDGETSTLLVSTVPVKDAEGRVVRILGVSEDVTQQLAAEHLGRALTDIGVAISSTLDFDLILDRLVELAARALSVESASLTVRQGDGWVIRQHYGAMTRGARSVMNDSGLAAAVLAAADEGPLAVTDAETDPRVDADMLRELGIKSLLAVPITVQRRVVAVLVFHRRAAPIGFAPEQVDFAGKLMGVASLALENARLYEHERRIANTLQEAILTPPPEVPQLETAYLYRPASSTANVGGDFYDVFTIGDRFAAIAVGDISGKGIEAARLTSLLKDGIRAYAYEHTGPAEIMQQLNDLVWRSSEVEVFATVFLGVLDLDTGELRYCAAGHPPPHLLTDHGVVRLREPRSGIVGAFPTTAFEPDAVQLNPGDTIVLYTDGITEARTGEEMFGERRVAETLEALRGGRLGDIPQGLADAAKEYGGGRLRDDTVVLCVRYSPEGA